ncbi:alpha/beta hydrolase [Defluviimonas sp. WL0002]|uniref:Alpha/beta hydrolase n=1 Tax=Albidovulum marisflavi TaxID=2984159 RepID=A0ABT2ZGM9_9RHOB|nr:alpha/beta hydrolase [Defluviimonas sp. WL0002]MCV2870294.1 alpha/beta hydrolase [Defluviimonas sp. WL0002]
MKLPLVLLPGMMCDARLFGPQIDALSSERVVIVMDLTAADSVQGLAVDVLAKAPPRFALAGLSMGGIVAMEIVRRARDRVPGLALLDTNPLAEDDAVKARRAPQMAKARAGRLGEVMRDEMKPNYLANGPDRQDVLDLCMAMAMDLGPEVFCRQSIALRDRPDQTEALRDYRGAALVLCGRQDALCPVSRHELMHSLIAGSRFEILEGAGHLPTLERPIETTAALRRWLSETDHG